MGAGRRPCGPPSRARSRAASGSWCSPRCSRSRRSTPRPAPRTTSAWWTAAPRCAAARWSRRPSPFGTGAIIPIQRLICGGWSARGKGRFRCSLRCLWGPPVPSHSNATRKTTLSFASAPDSNSVLPNHHTGVHSALGLEVEKSAGLGPFGDGVHDRADQVEASGRIACSDSRVTQQPQPQHHKQQAGTRRGTRRTWSQCHRFHPEPGRVIRRTTKLSPSGFRQKTQLQLPAPCSANGGGGCQKPWKGPKTANLWTCPPPRARHALRRCGA
mmetsp:Transcript_94741/g.159112  ORF Transcript_94741/g.159112 Transcript_94741/m.159112 type:complete len:271 (-) Transcript_94741:568-1380(-)